MPTNAAVRAGERLANIANAPAETIGGIPASNIETRTASPSNPNIFHKNNPAKGAAINFIESPMPIWELTFLLSRNVN